MREDPEASLVDFFTGGGLLAAVRRVVAPRSLNQQRYLQAMLEDDIVFCIGPAGTGKTYLAVAMAAAAMAEKQMRRIVLCRPAVEAGEKLGFLPGDLAEKVNPYLRPLYDALYDIIGFDKVEKMLERGAIEVAPLAFMRGRTLNESFIILDEAQNTTSEQMKMFLTRMGFGSKAVINGDLTQIDLPPGRTSGPARGRAGPRRRRGHPRSSTSTSATWCATRWCRRSSWRTRSTSAGATRRATRRAKTREAGDRGAGELGARRGAALGSGGKES